MSASWHWPLVLAAVIAGLGALFAACGDDGGAATTAPAGAQTVDPAAPALRVTSAAFEQGGEIPGEYSCDGAGGSPPLAWSHVPPGAKSLVLFVDDPDAPRSGGFVHWVAYGIPASTAGAEAGKPPPGATEGKNSGGSSGYTPPCPPSGQEHHYHFQVVALDFEPQLPAGKSEADVRKAIAGHVVGEGELAGRYRRR